MDRSRNQAPARAIESRGQGRAVASRGQPYLPACRKHRSEIVTQLHRALDRNVGQEIWGGCVELDLDQQRIGLDPHRISRSREMGYGSCRKNVRQAIAYSVIVVTSSFVTFPAGRCSADSISTWNLADPCAVALS